MNTENEFDTEFNTNHEKDTELVIGNDENDTEIDINNEDNIPNISLTDDVKELIKDLIVEQVDHNERQRSFFEELLRLWFGNNFTVRSIKEEQKHTGRLLNCKQYVCKMIAQYLPDGDNELYSAYFSLRRDGKYEVHNGDVCTLYYIKDVDMVEYAKYIRSINRKVVNQYNILVKNFELYLTEKAEDEGFLEDRDKLPKIRIKSQRNTTPISYAPFLKFSSTKKKKRTTYIDDFRKTITTKKKATVIFTFFTYYVFDWPFLDY